MSDTKEPDKKEKLRLSRPGKLELNKTVETGQVRQSFSHGRSKMVTVEVRKKRTFAPDSGGHMAEVKHQDLAIDEAFGGGVDEEATLAPAVSLTLE